MWNAETARLYWIDIKQRRLHCYRPSGHHHDTWELPDQPGALALQPGGGLVLALAGASPASTSPPAKRRAGRTQNPIGPATG